MSDRPFKVLGIQQIAVSSLDKNRLRKLWVDTLGLKLSGNYRSVSENVDEDIAVAGSGPLKVGSRSDAATRSRQETQGAGSATQSRGLVDRRSAGAVAWLQARGVRFAPGGIRKGASGFDICFIHPKGNEESPIGGEGCIDRTGPGAAGGM